MDIKRLYNSKKIYEGWFEAYFILPWINRYADFRNSESRRDCGWSLLAWLVVTLGVIGLLMGLVGLLGPETGFAVMKVVCIIWGALSAIPFIALLARTFNNSGKSTDTAQPRMLGVDMLLIGAAILFFIFGLLMMTTTLNSENLHPDPGSEEIDENAKIPADTVEEEAIFTYQNPPADTAAVVDTLADPDMLDPDESYDPTLEEGISPDEPLPNDSIYF